MRTCYIDYESYSEEDIGTAGAHTYVASHSFRPLLLAYAFDDDPVTVFEFDPVHPFNLPEEVESAALERDTMFVAHGQFDRLCLNKSLMRHGRDCKLPIRLYTDTMILASEAGLPPSLFGASLALKLETRKNPRGKAGIKWFSIPDEDGNQRMPESNPELWNHFLDYARDDVVICRILHQKLPPLIPAEQALYELDVKVNDRGILVDQTAARRLEDIAKKAVNHLNKTVAEVTHGEITSISQVAKIAQFIGTTSCAEAALKDGFNRELFQGDKLTVARARMEGAYTSAKKLPKMISGASPVDGRCRGQLQFCGTHTKRWAGRGFQLHNLPRESFKPGEMVDYLDAVRGGYESVAARYPDVLKSVSMAMRGMIIPAPGHTFAIADYSQIEARLVLWYAGQFDALEIFETGGDIYKEMASTVDDVAVDDVTGDQRFIGKTLVLGSGFGLGAKGLRRDLKGFGKLVEEDDAKHYTDSYRSRFDMVPKFWWHLQDALFNAVEGRPSRMQRTGLTFGKKGDSVYVEVATGARCWFHGARITDVPTPWDKSQTMKAVVARKYNAMGTYHEYVVSHMILAENVCSMTARELMGLAMRRLDSRGYAMIMSVHDELVIEVPDNCVDDETKEDICKLMCVRPPWGLDIPIAVGFDWSSRFAKY